LYYYTNGYPYLVSKMCKIIDEKLLPQLENKDWTINEVENAFLYITDEAYTTTIFDDLFKNLENHEELYQLVFALVINGEELKYNVNETVINLGAVFGIIANQNRHCAIHNRIFEQRIYNYLLVKQLRQTLRTTVTNRYAFIENDTLNFRLILQRFQQFMKENHSQKDNVFLEREGRLIFLSFLKPIINGTGFDFKEPVVGNERRMDIVITFNNNRDVLELKRWEGEQYHQKGLQQLSDYLDTYSLTQGYLLIFDFNQNKQYREQDIQFGDKQIFAVWV